MKIIGHAGAKGLAPANSLASLAKAIEYKVDVVEFDVRVTKDQKAILVHDPTIKDAAGNTLRVRDYTFKELHEHLPILITLQEALDFIDRRLPVRIDVKNNESTAPVIKIIHNYIQTGWTPNMIELTTRQWALMQQLHKAFPEHRLYVIDYWSGMRAVHRARKLNTRYISMLDYWLWPGFIRTMKRSGYELNSFPAFHQRSSAKWWTFGHAGTTNMPNKMKKWRRAGLAGAITDSPDRFKHE